VSTEAEKVPTQNRQSAEVGSDRQS
jgi:hypothetical protein